MLLAFVWVELVYAEHNDPSTVATLALAYAAVQLVGMSLYGVEAWTRNADGFSVYFGLFARLSPLHWRDRSLFVRLPLSGVTGLRAAPGTVALVCTMIGSTSFDGFGEGKLWLSDIVPEAQRTLIDVGFSPERSLEVMDTLGLALMILVIYGLYRLGVAGMRTVETGHPTAELARGFAHSLVPIALAYVMAHYFTLLVLDGQRLIYAISDPLGKGSDIFGTAGTQPDFGLIGANGIWYTQVAFVVAGHVAALVLAHDRALALYDDAKLAVRSQYWMLAIMVGFTSLALWLLSQANA